MRFGKADTPGTILTSTSLGTIKETSKVSHTVQAGVCFDTASLTDRNPQPFICCPYRESKNTANVSTAVTGIRECQPQGAEIKT